MSLPSDYQGWKKESRAWRRRARSLIGDARFEEPRTRPRDPDEAAVLRELGLGNEQPFSGLRGDQHPAAVIRRLRKASRLTQSDLAARLGGSQQQVQQLEDPRRSNPTWETLEAVAIALGRQARIVFE